MNHLRRPAFRPGIPSEVGLSDNFEEEKPDVIIFICLNQENESMSHMLGFGFVTRLVSSQNNHNALGFHYHQKFV